tara:strand:- start:1699 stop:1923 length:225 start_codon:yes stop_codon:yes gene_type:complete
MGYLIAFCITGCPYFLYQHYKNDIAIYNLKPNEIPKEKYLNIRMRQLVKNGISFKEAIIIISTENKMMKEGFIE